MKLVFIPGAGSTSAVWHYQSKHFTSASFINLPGHPVGTPRNSLEGYADWLNGYLLNAGYTDVVLVGHSMGGAIALTYALQYPANISGLVLIGTVGKFRSNPLFMEIIEAGIDNPSSWINTFIAPHYRLVAPRLRKRVIAEIAQVGAMVELNDFKCCEDFNIINRVRSIKLPALLISGSEDKMTPAKYSKYLADNIPVSRFEVIEGGTHVVFMEKHDAVNRAIERFLKGIKGDCL